MSSYDRRGFIGGSDIGAIFGVNPWTTALDLYEQKIAEEFVPPEVEPKREKLYRRGKKLEPWVMELLEEERGIFISKRNRIYVDHEFPGMRAEIDFEYMDDIGLCNGDVKTVSPFAAGEWGEEDTDEIPLSYCLQFHWGMMVAKRPICLVAVLIGADDLRVYKVHRDDELIAVIRQKVLEFWERVQKKIPPPPQTVGDVHKMLFKYGGFPVNNDPEIMTALQQLRTVKASEKEIGALKKQYEETIKRRLLVLAEAAGVTDTPKKFTINDCTGKRTASLSYEHRSGYIVKPTDFWILRS
jgi:putative phage-type endonuclease